MKELDSSVNKVGTARKVERSRIWLEGKRLLAAGFKPGDAIVAVWSEKKSRLVIEKINDGVVAYGPDAENRTVSGKGDKPIIDITGARVRDVLACAYVEVSYYPGRIVINPAE